MTDWTDRIIELEEAKAAMIAAKKAVKAEAERRARAQARREIADRVEELEHRFARRLAAANAEGMPQALIRKEVLRTGDWATWVKYRDLAEIAPERVVLRDAKKERQHAEALAKSHFRWSDDYATVTVVKNSSGDELEVPVIYTADTIRVKNELFYALPTSDRDELVAIKTDTYKGWMTQLHSELEAQIEAGNITSPEGE